MFEHLRDLTKTGWGRIGIVVFGLGSLAAIFNSDVVEHLIIPSLKSESNRASLRSGQPAEVPPATLAPFPFSCTVMDKSGTPLNVRSSPNGEIMGTIANGTPVKVLSSETLANGKRWSKISVKQLQGGQGWVFSAHLECR